MRSINIFDFEAYREISRKPLKKILRPDKQRPELHSIEELIEKFVHSPKPLYRYTGKDDFSINENTYNKAVEHFFNKFHRECFDDVGSGDICYRLLSCGGNRYSATHGGICAAMFVCEAYVIKKSFCFWIDYFSLPNNFSLTFSTPKFFI